MAGRGGPLRKASLLAAIVFAGCLGAPAAEETEPPLGGSPLPEPSRITLSLTLGGAVPWRVSALAWPVPGATTAVLLVHGHSGVKENYYHTAPDRGASLGARLAMTNRTVAAIDLPGYGESDGDPQAVSLELMADAVRAAARTLREGKEGFAAHDRVVAYGLSMGAIIVNLAASGHDDLDAIVPAGFPVTPATGRGTACESDPDCPEARALHNGEFYVPNLDWEVANATIAGYETTHEANLRDYALLLGPCVLQWAGLPTGATCGMPRLYETAAARVTVPVFTWVGDHDLPWLGSDLSTEAGYYPNAPRVDTWVVPDAGHFIHNHLTQARMVDRLSVWLAELGM